MALAAEMPPIAGRRRALLILTDGRDNSLARTVMRQGVIPASGEETEYLQMLRMARRERVPIYIVAISNNGSEVSEIRRMYFDEAASAYVEAVASRLELLAEGGGGRVTFPKNLQDIIPLYAQISRELGSAYSIGYVSNVPAEFQGFREIKISTKDGQALHVIQSRPGYVVAP